MLTHDLNQIAVVNSDGVLLALLDTAQWQNTCQDSYCEIRYPSICLTEPVLLVMSS